MWAFSECGRYCVRIATSKIAELTQFERVKSMIRNLPANGTEGLARFSERTLRRVPSPPAMIMATTRTDDLQHSRRIHYEHPLKTRAVGSVAGRYGVTIPYVAAAVPTRRVFQAYVI